jgi:hypothetical protein
VAGSSSEKSRSANNEVRRSIFITVPRVIAATLLFLKAGAGHPAMNADSKDSPRGWPSPVTPGQKLLLGDIQTRSLQDDAGPSRRTLHILSPVSHRQPWRLLNMEADRTEQHDQAQQQPERVARLKAAWNAWAQRTFVDEWPDPDHTEWGEDIKPATRAQAPIALPTALTSSSSSGNSPVSSLE